MVKLLYKPVSILGTRKVTGVWPGKGGRQPDRKP
jgi:hypothetical protein